jgi:hypothetical protein
VLLVHLGIGDGGGIGLLQLGGCKLIVLPQMRADRCVLLLGVGVAEGNALLGLAVAIRVLE